MWWKLKRENLSHRKSKKMLEIYTAELRKAMFKKSKLILKCSLLPSSSSSSSISVLNIGQYTDVSNDSSIFASNMICMFIYFILIFDRNGPIYQLNARSCDILVSKYYPVNNNIISFFNYKKTYPNQLARRLDYLYTLWKNRLGLD